MSAPNIIRNINALKEILTLSGQDSVILGKYVGRSSKEKYTPRIIPIDTLIERISELLLADPEFVQECADAVKDIVNGENLGTGVEVFKEYDSGIFKFHTLVEGDGITIELDELTGEISISSDGGDASLYTNEDPTPTTIGGIPAGSTFLDVPHNEMWDRLLYPYQPPSVSISSPLFKTYEVGELLPSGLQTINYSVTNPSNIATQPPNVGVITSFIVGSSIPVNPIELLASGSFDIDIAPGSTLTISASQGLSLQGTNSQSGTFSDSANVTFRHKRYWGTHPTFSVPSDAQIIAADGAGVGSGSEFATSRVQTRNGINGGGDYIFFAWPETFGNPTFIVNGLPNTAWTKIGAGIGFTNASGFTERYDVWISNTQQNSPITQLQIN
jgi:hypothetical protein